jgi:hypothetical protein
MARLHKVWVERSQADSAERNESLPFTCYQENCDGDDTAATLVIHDIDTEHERVFTESEVRAAAMAEPGAAGAKCRMRCGKRAGQTVRPCKKRCAWWSGSLAMEYLGVFSIPPNGPAGCCRWLCNGSNRHVGGSAFVFRSLSLGRLC